MKTMLEMEQMLQIVDGVHSDPHQVLGMHETQENGTAVLVVRAFCPKAMEITVLDAKDTTKHYPMVKIHADGFFEGIIPKREKWFPYQYKVTTPDGNSWITHDPYRFAPIITEYDCYLFGAGTHYGIFDKLGAHPCSIEGVSGVAFGVWAPNAKTVSVIGDFNGWDRRRHPMRLLGESGIWELFVPLMQKGDIYKFSIRTRQDVILEKADPYASFAEVRPATASVVWDSSEYNWWDEEWIASRNAENQYEKPMNIYEVHFGSWMRDGADGNRPMTYLEGAEKLVSYVKEMGFSHIEFLPLAEHPFDGSWGYQVTGYYAPTSRYGTPEELKELIDICHQNHIGVLLDWVPAHFPKDSFALARFDGSALYEHQDPKKGEHPEWGTYVFNYGRNEVKNFLIANAIYWIQEFHLDGLRVDAVASMLYLDYAKAEGQWVPNKYGGRENLEAEEFLKHMNSVICGRYPGVMMIAEESTSWIGVTKDSKYGGLGFSMKWNMGWMNDFLTYLKKDPIYRKHHQNCLTFGMVYAYSENFVLVLSHDEVVHEKGSMVGKAPGDMWQKFANLRVAYGFMYGHPGKKLLFMGNEFGQFSEWSEDRSLDWHLLQYESHKGLQNYMKDLNHLYLQNPIFWEMDFDPNGFSWLECDDAQSSIITFVRRDRNRKELIFVCNFTPNANLEYRMGVGKEGRYQEIFNSDKEEYGGSGIYNGKVLKTQPISWNKQQHSIVIQVPPLGMSIFQRVLA